jgi:hypothetical protein
MKAGEIADERACEVAPFQNSDAAAFGLADHHHGG